MTSGLFSFLCPECGRELRPEGDGRHVCSSCGQAYTVLFGCLIRTDVAPTTSPPPPGDGPVSLAS